MRQLIELLINDIPFIHNNGDDIALVLTILISFPIIIYVLYLVLDVLKSDSK